MSGWHNDVQIKRLSTWLGERAETHWKLNSACIVSDRQNLRSDEDRGQHEKSLTERDGELLITRAKWKLLKISPVSHQTFIFLISAGVRAKAPSGGGSGVNNRRWTNKDAAGGCVPTSY